MLPTQTTDDLLHGVGFSTLKVTSSLWIYTGDMNVTALWKAVNSLLRVRCSWSHGQIHKVRLPFLTFCQSPQITPVLANWHSTTSHLHTHCVLPSLSPRTSAPSPPPSPHEITFIIGLSASGQSTVAQLLLRMHSAQVGHITIDDKPTLQGRAIVEWSSWMGRAYPRTSPLVCVINGCTLWRRKRWRMGAVRR